jgi:hypothetical protein
MYRVNGVLVSLTSELGYCRSQMEAMNSQRRGRHAVILLKGG